jgi:hypothetical protein
MKSSRTLKQGLARVQKLHRNGEFAKAFAEVEALMRDWPGSVALTLQWTTLAQLKEGDEPSLDAIRRALESAVQLEPDAPAAGIELGHFLDAVEDDPRSAAKTFSEAAAVARRLLREALVGEAKALVQLDKKKEARRCLMELLPLSDPGEADTAELEDLLHDVLANKSA